MYAIRSYYEKAKIDVILPQLIYEEFSLNIEIELTGLLESDDKKVEKMQADIIAKMPVYTPPADKKSEKPASVITSYSIHYTKLYD